MGVTRATLAGELATRARVMLHAWGCWYADVSIDGEHQLTGAVELVIADLTLKGTVLSGGPAQGRSFYRLVAGAGGWGKTIKRDSSQSDAGVKISKILTQAAAAVGETLDPATLPTGTAGPAWTRIEGPAARVLEQLAPGAWYVGEDGVTRIGRRARAELDGAVPRVTPIDHARGTVTLAPTSIATILPGVVVDGLEAVDVEHEISSKEGLRTTIWGAKTTGTSRRLSAFRELIEQLFPELPFLATREYRVVGQTGERVDLEPARKSTGLPDLPRVSIRPGVSGCRSDLMLGARVIVAFVDGDPAQPNVIALESADGEGFLPLETSIDAQTVVRIGAGLLPLARAGDLAGGLWPIVPSQVKALG